MTMVDPITGWFEVARLRNGPTALKAQRLLDLVWLARYPSLNKFDLMVGENSRLSSRNCGHVPAPGVAKLKT